MQTMSMKGYEKPQSCTLCYIPKRYISTLLGFFGIFTVYILRSNVSVALVAMVNSTAHGSENDSHLPSDCPDLVPSDNGTTVQKFKGEQYDWDIQTQSYIMSSFFYCYFVTVLTGGYLADRFGAKRTLGGGVFLTAVLTLLTPIIVRWGLIPFLILRALEGISEGVTFPAINVLVGRWAPPLERSRISTCIFFGMSLGNVFSFTVAGWLCSTDFLGGWPSVFYVFGALGCVWFAFWILFFYETPRGHPTISKEELALYHRTGDETLMKQVKLQNVPWKKIATSVPAWAVIIAHSGDVFGIVILLTELPTYLSSALHFSIQDSGSTTGIPYLCDCVGGLMASWAADKMIASGKWCNTTVRKIFNSLSYYGMVACLLGLTVARCNPTAVIILYSLCLYMHGIRCSGFNVTHVEMCAPLAGTLYGISNGIGYMIALTGPIIVGALTRSGATVSNWNNVFYITAAVFFVTGTVYVIFASAEPQNWLDEKTANKNPDTNTIAEGKL